MYRVDHSGTWTYHDTARAAWRAAYHAARLNRRLFGRSTPAVDRITRDGRYLPWAKPWVKWE